MYLRLEDEQEALQWYQKLAEMFESRELLPNAIAAYKKVLRLSPKNHQILMYMAALCERQGDVVNAKLYYRIMASQWLDVGKHDQAIAAYHKICELHPECTDSWLELARLLERFGGPQEAAHAYLTCAEILARRGKTTEVGSVVESIFRLKPSDKEFVKSFFTLLESIHLTERGIEYLQSLSMDHDPEFQVQVAEVVLRDKSQEVAQKYLIGNVQKNPNLYPLAVELLQQLIAEGEVGGSMELLDAIFVVAIQRHDESTLAVMLETLLELDALNLRILKTLTTLLIRMDNHRSLEEYLKRLLTLQLRNGNWREARESLNKMVVYGQNSFYLDLLHLLNEAMQSGSPEDLQESGLKVIQILERGTWEEKESVSSMGMALGVSELDLGMSLEIEQEEAQ